MELDTLVKISKLFLLILYFLCIFANVFRFTNVTISLFRVQRYQNIHKNMNIW